MRQAFTHTFSQPWLSALLLVLATSACSGLTASPARAEDFISGTQARELIRDQGAILVDVRTPEEYAQKHVPGAMLFPLQSLQGDLFHLGSFDRPMVVYCRSGRRATEAIRILSGAGFQKLYNMGGVENWER